MFLVLVDGSDIFYFFCCSGRGKGSPRRRWGGGSIFIENPSRGSPGETEADRPGGYLRRIGELGGGELNILFWGRNAHQVVFFSAAFLLFSPVFCSMPGVDPPVPHILWIDYEENWDDRLSQGWGWVP